MVTCIHRHLHRRHISRRLPLHYIVAHAASVDLLASACNADVQLCWSYNVEYRRTLDVADVDARIVKKLSDAQPGNNNIEIPMSTKCGIIMPISAIDGCGETHWVDVMEILKSAILKAGFEPRIVSSSNEIGIIHKTIIQNLYEDPIVVCDVSGKNPNVMFELGMRLAFDKPTVIVKDDKTDYSFDTSGIQHIPYPRDLRFSRIGTFQSSLTEKITATVRAATEDPNYTTFLKHFGDFKVAKIDKQEVSGQDYIISELQDLKAQISALGRRAFEKETTTYPGLPDKDIPIVLRKDLDKDRSSLMRHIDNVTIYEARKILGKDFRPGDDENDFIIPALRQMDETSRVRAYTMLAAYYKSRDQ